MSRDDPAGNGPRDPVSWSGPLLPEDGEHLSESARLVLRYFQMWNGGDTSGIDEILAPDWTDHAHPEIRSHQDVRAAVERIRAARPDLRFRIDAVLGSGDLVAAIGGVDTAAPAGGVPTGRPAGLVWLVQVTNGRMAELRTYHEDRAQS